MQKTLFDINHLNDANKPVITNNDERVVRLAALRKKVFKYGKSSEDELIFRRAIFQYLLGKKKETLKETMWLEVWERNEQGRFGKYTYFNERIQKVYLDRDFFEWCKLSCELMNEELSKNDGVWSFND